jgi:hypothetical protein
MRGRRYPQHMRYPELSHGNGAEMRKIP